ncbi:MAG: TIGR03086 family metal-binding protein [Nocardioides sp.]
METKTNNLATDWRQAAARIASVMAAVDRADAWGQPSACADWAAADVLNHLVETQKDFLTQHGLVLPEVASSPEDSSTPPGSPAPAAIAQWEAIARLLDDPDVRDRSYEGYFGPTTLGETLGRFYGFDLVVHRWDLAQALGGSGKQERFSEDELDQIEAAADSFGDVLYADGICRPAVPVSPDADRQARVLAKLGRVG